MEGIFVKNLHGRGWDRYGYADIIEPDGDIINITPYDEDDFVDSNEITWGAVGVNSISRHIALAGGIHPDGRKNGQWPFEEIYTDEQFVMLSAYYNQTVKDNPDIKIVGHYEIPNAGKTCPNFNVADFCRSIGIPKKNIGLLV